MDSDLLTRDYRRPEHSLPLLRCIKHTRLEGAIVEHEMNQVLLPAFVDAGWRPIDALVLRRYARQGRSHEIDVLSRDEEAVTSALIHALRTTGIPVRRLAIDGNRLLVLDDQSGRPLSEPVNIQPAPPEGAVNLTDPSSVVDDRVLAAFWGFAVHLDEGINRLVADLMIKDLYVGPYSRGLWDLDRFLLGPDGKLIYIEAKHKYPIPRHMSFGMNRGEVEQARLLTRAGIHAWHVILVKPHWDRTASSMYLFFDRQARERALWIAADMAEESLWLSGQTGSATADTSIYGRNRVAYEILRLGAFRLLGRNTEPAAEIGARFLDLVTAGGCAPLVSEEMLREARLS